MNNRKKICTSCNRELVVKDNFYNSNNPIGDGKSPMCKKCIKDSIDYNNIKTIQDVLRGMDTPFLIDLWERCYGKRGDQFGNYLRNLNLLPNIKDLTWEDSQLEHKDNIAKETVPPPSIPSISFKVTSDMIMRWGQNHQFDDYIKLEEFYHSMKDMNKIETPQDETYLKKLAVISLKMDQELEAGNYGQVKQLGDLFSKYMADSKFRAMDKTEADKTGGIRTFGSIYAEVEKDGHIPPWEHYRKIKGITQDIVDQTIMHIENFTLRLNKIERMIEPPIDTPQINLDVNSELP